MTKIELEIFDDIVTTLNKIKDINDNGIQLVIPEGSILFENVLNLKLIKKHADKYGMTVHYETDDPAGNTLIEMIEEGVEGMPRKINDEELTQLSVPTKTINTLNSGAFLSKFTHILKALDKFKQKIPLKAALIPPVIISLLLVVLYHFAKNTSDADVKLVINSQPLTKSMTIKVKAYSPSNAEQRILAGTNVQDTIEITKEIDTTGEKIVGEKAEGKIKIFNKTESEKTFKKGQVVVYDEEEIEYEFLLNEEITVEAATEDNTNPLDPVVVYGEAEVAVTAAQVGENYNIDKNKALSIDGAKKADFSAVTTIDFSGGKSEKIKVVAEADITKAKAELDGETSAKADSALNAKVASSQALIKGSSKNTIVKEEPDKKVGDEADKVIVKRTVSVEGLVYLKDELNRLLDSLTKEVVPEGFVLSSKDRETSVEVLGATSSSTLSSTEADIQVTLKAFIVPDISEDNIKTQIAGKSSKEAEEILNNVRNIKTFEFKLNRGVIPIFTKVPKDLDKIHVEIVKE